MSADQEDADREAVAALFRPRLRAWPHLTVNDVAAALGWEYNRARAAVLTLRAAGTVTRYRKRGVQSWLWTAEKPFPPHPMERCHAPT